MRKLKAWQYVTLDGVVEAPENWVMADERMFEEQTAEYAGSDALLLGRRTYEIFAASWPQRGSDVPNADWMNNTQKYVASKTLDAPESVLGAGKRLFENTDDRADLELVECHPYENGVVSLSYAPRQE